MLSLNDPNLSAFLNEGGVFARWLVVRVENDGCVNTIAAACHGRALARVRNQLLRRSQEPQDEFDYMVFDANELRKNDLVSWPGWLARHHYPDEGE